MSAFQPWTEPHFKPTKAEARAERDDQKQSVKDKEDRHKSAARKRDGWMCRFPRCGCHRRRLHPEVAHSTSKGMGGDHGTLSHVYQMICLCKDRHQDSRISLHKGTLRMEFLTTKGTNGPVRWWVDVTAIDTSAARRRSGDEHWVAVASESDVRVLEPLTPEQGALLERIAELAA